MLIYGASGHAKVIIDIINSNSGKEVIKFIFDDDPKIGSLIGYSVEHSWSKELEKEPAILAIGNNHIRRKLAGKLLQFHSALIHSKATLSERSQIGKGTVVMAGAVINADVKIGRHCIINTGAIIEHDVKANDYCHVSPGAVITGNVEIGKGAHVGAGSTIIPGISVGKWAIIGAGAVVIEDVPDFAVVVGNPAKIIKYNKYEDEEK